MSDKPTDDLIARINQIIPSGSETLVVEGGTCDSREGKSTFYGVWAALHRGDGSELSEGTAPGYERVPYTTSGAVWTDIPAEWGWVKFMSAWTQKMGGRCVSDPPLQPVDGVAKVTPPSSPVR